MFSLARSSLSAARRTTASNVGSLKLGLRAMSSDSDAVTFDLTGSFTVGFNMYGLALN